jgi:hypothetical protein|tara:strand:- start:872 stop:2305 length:1434 start_codon:yes stop_codon:yes gene_type:complete
MKISEKELRRQIKYELLAEQAVATGGGKSTYTQAERQRIADSVRSEFISQATSGGIIKPGDEWSLDIYIGPTFIKVTRLSGSFGTPNTVDKGAIKRIVRSIANNVDLLDRTQLKGFRGLELAISSGAAKGRAADVKPRTGGPPRKRRTDDCIVGLQASINTALANDKTFVPLDTDGILGPLTKKAWIRAGGAPGGLDQYSKGDPCPKLPKTGGGAPPVPDPDVPPVGEEKECYMIDCRVMVRASENFSTGRKKWIKLMQKADGNPDDYWDEEWSWKERTGGKQAANWKGRDVGFKDMDQVLKMLARACKMQDNVQIRGATYVSIPVENRPDVDKAVSKTRLASKSLMDFRTGFLDNPRTNQGRFTPGGGPLDPGDATPGPEYDSLDRAVDRMTRAVELARREFLTSLENPMPCVSKKEQAVAEPPPGGIITNVEDLTADDLPKALGDMPDFAPYPTERGALEESNRRELVDLLKVIY